MKTTSLSEKRKNSSDTEKNLYHFQHGTKSGLKAVRFKAKAAAAQGETCGESQAANNRLLVLSSKITAINLSCQSSSVMHKENKISQITMKQRSAQIRSVCENKFPLRVDRSSG